MVPGQIPLYSAKKPPCIKIRRILFNTGIFLKKSSPDLCLNCEADSISFNIIYVYLNLSRQSYFVLDHKIPVEFSSYSINKIGNNLDHKRMDNIVTTFELFFFFFNSIQFIVTKQSCTQIEQSLNSNRICDNEDETQGVCVLSLLQPNI